MTRRLPAVVVAALMLGALGACGGGGGGDRDISRSEVTSALDGVDGVQSFRVRCAKAMSGSSGCVVAVEAANSATAQDLGAIVKATSRLMEDADTLEVRVMDWLDGELDHADVLLTSHGSSPAIDPAALVRALDAVQQQDVGVLTIDDEVARATPADGAADAAAMVKIARAIEATGVSQSTEVALPSSADPTLKVLVEGGQDVSAALEVHEALAKRHTFDRALISPSGLSLRTSTPETAAAAEKQARSLPRFGELAEFSVKVP